MTESPRDAWAVELKGLLAASTAAARLDVDERVLDEAVAAGRVIELRDGSGTAVYPGFQFAEGWPPPPLVEAWRIIAAASSPWTAAAWAVAPDDALGSRPPAACTRGSDARRMLRVARQDAARLAA